MKRRSFLSQMIRAGVACMALPAATTYARIWTPKIITPDEFAGYSCVIDPAPKKELWEIEWMTIVTLPPGQRFVWIENISDEKT